MYVARAKSLEPIRLAFLFLFKIVAPEYLFCSFTMESSASSIRFGPDDLVVNFHDACVYGRDLALFESPCGWLNDACINFVMTDLQVTHDDAHDNAKQKKKEKTVTTTLFLDPAVVAFLMHQCHDEDDFADFSRGCRGFVGITRLVIPINDTLTSRNWAIPGKGSHWSLLLLERGVDGPRGYHFDSVSQSGNLCVAQAVANKVCLASGGVFSSSSETKMIKVQACRTPVQRNGYDCGIHVVAAARVIAGVGASMCTGNAIPDVYEAELDLRINDGASFCLKLRKEVVGRMLKLANSHQ